MSKLLEKVIQTEITPFRFYLVLGVFASCYFVFAFLFLFQPECFGHMRCFDYDRRERDLYAWQYEDFFEEFDIRHSLTFLLLEASKDFLGSNKILPMVSSAGFIVLTGVFARRVIGSMTLALVPAFLMLVDPLFIRYSVSVAYPNFWASAFMVSVILMFSKPAFSFGGWIFSCLLKIINFVYFPVLVLLSDWQKSRKIVAILSFFVLLVIGVFAYQFMFPESDQFRHFRLGDFVYGLSMWSYDMRDDRIALGLIFVSLFFCIILNKYKVLNARKMLASILFFLVTPAIISAFSTFTIEPYRFLVMIAFVYTTFALGLRNIKLVADDLKKFGKS